MTIFMTFLNMSNGYNDVAVMIQFLEIDTNYSDHSNLTFISYMYVHIKTYI